MEGTCIEVILSSLQELSGGVEQTVDMPSSVANVAEKYVFFVNRALLDLALFVLIWAGEGVSGEHSRTSMVCKKKSAWDWMEGA